MISYLRQTIMATGVVIPVALFSFSAAAVDESDFRNLERTVKQLEQQLEEAKRQLNALSEHLDKNTQAVEATAEAVDSIETAPSVFDRLSVGGYGELHYNNLNAEDSARDKNQIDFHRFVLFLGYEYSDNLRFFSEVELEHSLAGEGKPGEVELEQAFIEYDFNSRHTGRAGLFLLPVGILNETHEPPTFYGVERNAVENVIIPTTWWAGGLGYTHRTDRGITFDVALHEGLNIGTPSVTDLPAPAMNSSRLDSVRIRSGRQKTAEADADDLALTGRVRYTGMPGLELAATAQLQQDITQESHDIIDDARLYEAHIVFNKGPFGLRALYALWDIDIAGTVGDNTLDDGGYDRQHGWYIEPSYRLTEAWGVFARYEDVEGGRSQDLFDQWTAGFNFHPHENVVLKADYQNRDHDDMAEQGRDYNGFNLGVGYQF